MNQKNHRHLKSREFQCCFNLVTFWPVYLKFHVEKAVIDLGFNTHTHIHRGWLEVNYRRRQCARSIDISTRSRAHRTTIFDVWRRIHHGPVLYDSQILCTAAHSSFHLLPGRVVIVGASTSSPTPMIDGCHSVMPTVKRITMCEFRICAKVLFTVSRETNIFSSSFNFYSCGADIISPQLSSTILH